MKNQKYSGFPIWMLFLLTCMLSWASVLAAGIMSGHKKWIKFGILYAIPFVLVVIAFSTDEGALKRSEIKSKIEIKSEFSQADAKKFAQAIKIQVQIDTAKAKLKEFKKTKKDGTLTEYNRQKREFEKEVTILKNELSKAIDKATPELREPWYLNLIIALWFLSVLAAFIHAFTIREKYWSILRQKHKLENDKIVNPEKYEKKLSENEKILKQVQELKQEILTTIKKSKELDAYIVDDIKTMVENYAGQVNKLIEQSEILEKQCRNVNPKELSDKIVELEAKMTETTDESLLNDYKTTISAKKKLRDSEQELVNLHEKVKLRIQNSFTALRQVKFDINKLEGMFTKTDKERFFNEFQNKSSELSEYVKAVDQSYKENSL